MNAPSPAAPEPKHGEPQSSPPSGRGGVYFKIELIFKYFWLALIMPQVPKEKNKFK
jgi:hypothetical protein